MILHLILCILLIIIGNLEYLHNFVVNPLIDSKLKSNASFDEIGCLSYDFNVTSWRWDNRSYTAMCLWFAYVEGYKGFQTKFSPLVVSRSFTLCGNGKTPFHHILFGPFYSMGLFHATKKRKIISWSVTTGVAMIVALVKRLPYPWRNIVDAGVVVGLTWGTLAIGLIWLKAFFSGNNPTYDPALPSSD